MKTKIGSIITFLVLVSCNNTVEQEKLPITGTWQFLSGTIINNSTKDITVTDLTKNQTGIKIITATHFAFLIHDLKKGKEEPVIFTSGGGRCTIEGNKYTEYLEYCNYRDWENMKVEFTATIQHDTLTLSGIEKNDSLGIDQINSEKYVRVK